METEIWLKIEAKKKYQRWYAGNAHAYKTKPSTNDNEIAVKIVMTIPDEVFEEPVFEAKLVLPKTTRQFPEMTEVCKEVSKALGEKMGFRVKLEMPTENPNPLGEAR